MEQGYLLSLNLFLIVIDWITKKAIDKPRGIQWTMVKRLEDLDFADDLVLLSHQIKDIREKINKLSEIGKKIWLNSNSKKTKIMKVKTMVC